MNLKAIALFSGGLDSTLAMKIVADQGVEVIALYVNIGFSGKRERREHMKNMCKQVGATFLEIDIREQFLREVLFSPKYGYGKNFNPCIDCHGNMFKIAKEMMTELGASFLISGEVVGQRPMSQNMESLQKVVNLSESEDILLRPLSAQHFPETLPEREGWVDRSKLFHIIGRGRETQLKLAEEFGLKDFDPPAGGCLLTEPTFAVKMFDFVKFDKMAVSDIDLLKFGRHFRLEDGAKLIIGRNSEDNDGLRVSQNEKFISLEAKDLMTPFALLSKKHSKKDFNFALQTLLSYTKAEKGKTYTIIVNGVDEVFSSPLKDREFARTNFLL